MIKNIFFFLCFVTFSLFYVFFGSKKQKRYSKVNIFSVKEYIKNLKMRSKASAKKQLREADLHVVSDSSDKSQLAIKRLTKYRKAKLLEHIHYVSFDNLVKIMGINLRFDSIPRFIVANFGEREMMFIAKNVCVSVVDEINSKKDPYWKKDAYDFNRIKLNFDEIELLKEKK